MALTKQEWDNRTALGVNPFEHNYSNQMRGVDLTQIPTKELENYLSLLTKEYDRRTMDTPLPSPTRRQCLADETLAQAYDALAILMKLKGHK